MTRYREQANWQRPEREGGYEGEREWYGRHDRDNDREGRRQYEQTGQSSQSNYCSACGSSLRGEESYGGGQQEYQRASWEQDPRRGERESRSHRDSERQGGGYGQGGYSQGGYGQSGYSQSGGQGGYGQGGGYGSFSRGGTFAGQGQTHQRYGDSDWMGGWSGAGSDFDYGRATHGRASRGYRGGSSQFESGQGNRSGSEGRSQGQYGQSAYGGGQDYRGKGPKGYKRSDQRIKEDVSEELKTSSEVDASNIEIDVKEGEVTLRGEVQSKREKRAAEECIENLPGVDDVNNQIRVRSGSSRAGSDSGDSNESQKSTAGATTSSSTSSKSSQRFGTSS